MVAEKQDEHIEQWIFTSVAPEMEIELGKPLTCGETLSPLSSIYPEGVRMVVTLLLRDSFIYLVCAEN